MPKAVLVIDMPESCADCQLADDDPSGLYCVPEDEYYDGKESTEDRASFCPLRQLPEKRRTIGDESKSDALIMNAGFNACLDEILK
jgi:hypothetical protein